jgi:hypothetical protein
MPKLRQGHEPCEREQEQLRHKQEAKDEEEARAIGSEPPNYPQKDARGEEDVMMTIWKMKKQKMKNMKMRKRKMMRMESM